MRIDKFIFWGLCAILVFIPLPFGGTEKWAVFVFEGMTAALVILHLAREGKGGGNPGRGGNGFLKILILVFLALSAVQIIPLPPSLVRLIAPSTAAVRDVLSGTGLGLGGERGWQTLSLVPGLSFDELVKYVFFGLFAWLVFKRVRTNKEAGTFVLVLVLGGAVQALYGLAEVFGGTERIFGYKKIYYLGSATGTFINRDHFSGFLEMLFPLSLGFLLAKADFFGFQRGLSFKQKILWFGQERLQKSVVFGLLPVVIGLGIVFSRSRTGLFVLVVTIVLMLVVLSLAGRGGESKSPEAGGRRFATVLKTIGLLVVFSAVLIGIKPVIERFSWSEIEKESRPVFFRNTAALIARYPVWGAGLGTFRYVYPQFEKKFLPHLVDHAHNDYLETLAESGLAGGGCLILAALWTAAVLFGRWAKRRDPLARGILLGACLGITALLIHSLTDFNLRIPANAVYFLTLCALGLGLSRSGRTGREFSKTPETEASNDEGGKRPAEEERRPGLKPWRRAFLTTGTAVLFAAASLHFAGDSWFRKYQAARARAASIESGFPGMESHLRRAVRFHGHPVYHRELGRLYLERALGENAFGSVENRDSHLDSAIDALALAVTKNPLDASAFYDLGRVYMLYNDPVPIYQDKARRFFRRALELDPADEFLNTKVLFLFLAQWDSLEEGERAFVDSRLADASRDNPGFLDSIRRIWKKSFGDTRRLDDIL